MRGKQSGSGTMEEPCRAFDTKPSTTALKSEPVSETDVSHGKHQTDPIQGKSSKADEHGPEELMYKGVFLVSYTLTGACDEYSALLRHKWYATHSGVFPSFSRPQKHPNIIDIEH
jgi:hypothetical protein